MTLAPPILSAIVCTYNRARMLRQCLAALGRQTLDERRYEILVIDNNSSDGTPEVAERFAAGRENVRYFRETRQGLSHARNRGVAEAAGEIVTFVDDDGLVESTYLAEILRAFDENPGVECVGGPVEIRPDGPIPRWLDGRLLMCLSRYDAGDRAAFLDDLPGPLGGNMSVRRATLLALGGFDPGLGRSGRAMLSNEERLLVERIKKGRVQSVLYWPGHRLYHCMPAAKLARREILKRMFWQGISDAAMPATPILSGDMQYDSTTRRGSLLALPRTGSLMEPAADLAYDLGALREIACRYGPVRAAGLVLRRIFKVLRCFT